MSARLKTEATKKKPNRIMEKDNNFVWNDWQTTNKPLFNATDISFDAYK